MHIRPSVPLFALLLVIAAAPRSIGQIEKGAISGVVTDQAGAVIADIAIEATHLETRQIFQTRSDDTGTFQFTLLPFGDYSLTFTSQGFATLVVRVMLDREASSAPHNAQLQVAPAHVRLEVKLQSAAVEATICVVCGYTYFSLPYSDLPLFNRDPQQLIQLRPGIIAHNDDLSIGGRRPANKNASLEGLDNRDIATGKFIASVSLDALQELKPDSDLRSDYDQSDSASLGVTAKAGSNTYHGSAYWRLGRAGFDANNFFANRVSLSDDRSLHDQVSGTAGGPLSLPGLFSGRDRFFFFAAYERERQRATTGRQIVAPLASFIERTSTIQGPLFRSLLEQKRIPLSKGNLGGLQDVDGDSLADIGDAAAQSLSSFARSLASSRIDIVLTDRIQIAALYAQDQSSLTDEWNEISLTPASPLNATHRGQFAGIRLTTVLNPRTVIETQFGFRKGRTLLAGAGTDAPQLIALNSPIEAGSGLPELPEQRSEQSELFGGNLAQVAGAHNIRVNAQIIRRSARYQNSALVNGRVYYSDLLALATDGRVSAGDPLRAIIRAEIADEPYSEHYRATDFYGSVSDEWRASPRFTTTFGLGYNIYSGAIYDGSKTDRNNFAPFVSFALGLTHSEKVILRGGASINYIPPTALAYGEVKTTPLYPVAARFADAGELVGQSLPRKWIDSPQAVEIESVFSKDFRTSYTESAFLAAQFTFGRGFLVEAGYHTTLGHRLVRASRPDRPGIDHLARSQQDEEEILIASDTNSSYHSLQLRVTSREDRNLIFSAHYTLSKSIDRASDDRPSMFRALALGPVSEMNYRAERGPSDFDRRYRVVGFFLWRSPSLDNASRVMRAIAGDWRLSGIVTLQSGPLVSVYSGGDFFGERGDFNRDGLLNDRLVFSGRGGIGSAINRASSPADGYFNRSLFAPPRGADVGGRNLLPAPGLASLDLSLGKRIPFGDRHRLELQAEVFNATNRTNFVPPVTDFTSASFGRSRESLHPRIIRLALRYNF